jgi:hypothetical protein
MPRSSTSSAHSSIRAETSARPVTWPKPPPVGQAARLSPLGGEHRLAGPDSRHQLLDRGDPLLAASLYEDQSVGLHEDASARRREHPGLLCCSILRGPSAASSVGGHEDPLAATRDGIVAITESDRISGARPCGSSSLPSICSLGRVTVTAHARSDLPVMVLAVFKTRSATLVTCGDSVATGDLGTYLAQPHDRHQ